MPVQGLDLSATTLETNFNGSAVEQINLNGSGIWTKPGGFPAVDSSWTETYSTVGYSSYYNALASNSYYTKLTSTANSLAWYTLRTDHYHQIGSPSEANAYFPFPVLRKAGITDIDFFISFISSGINNDHVFRSQMTYNNPVLGQYAGSTLSLTAPNGANVRAVNSQNLDLILNLPTIDCYNACNLAAPSNAPTMAFVNALAPLFTTTGIEWKFYIKVN